MKDTSIEKMKTCGLKAAKKLTFQIDYNCISSMALMALKACYCDLQLLLCQSDNNSEAAQGCTCPDSYCQAEDGQHTQWKDQCCHPMDINKTAAIRSILFWFFYTRSVGAVDRTLQFSPMVMNSIQLPQKP